MMGEDGMAIFTRNQSAPSIHRLERNKYDSREKGESEGGLRVI